jgi:hypothetical protein
MAAGVLLILAGAGLLAFQKLEIFNYFFLVLGLGMTVLGILTRTSGWMIPGGILGGIGLGIALLESPLSNIEPSLDEGGIFMLCMGAGFLSITLFSKLFGECTHTWALIPGAIITTIGGLILLQEPGLKVLEFISSYWPVVLILMGCWILIKLARRPEQS